MAFVPGRVRIPGNTKPKKTMNPNPSVGSGTSKNVLNADVEIKGSLKLSGELSLDGKVEGEIQSEGVLHVGETAVINGNVTAQSVVVRGKIHGNVTAKEKIELKAKAELFGDLRASKLSVEEGVTFVGKTEVNPNKVAPLPQQRAAEGARPPELARVGAR
jgi:cytoskeletal protein CcmA (bactofilin family)